MKTTITVENEAGGAAITCAEEVGNLQDFIELLVEPVLLAFGFPSEDVNEALYDGDGNEEEVVYHPACDMCMGLMGGNC
jgi:hypothetical protein